MENTLLEHWQKNGSDFPAGVSLLAQHGSDLVTKTILARLKIVAFTGEQPNTYELGKLTGALGKITTAQLSESLKLSESSPAQQRTTNNQQPATSNQQRPTSDKAKELHKLHAHHHTLMATAFTDADRAKHSAIIMQEILPALDAEYARLKGNAEPPGALAVAPILNFTDADKLRRLQSLRTRIGQLKKKLLNPKDLKTKQKYETELAEKEAERDRLQAELA